MRKPKPITHEDGTTVYRVRYRLGGKETSETFRRLPDAEVFAGILGDGRNDRVTEALAWLHAKQNDRESQTFAQWFDYWLPQLTGITTGTRDGYKAIHRRYLTELDAVPLPLISRAHITNIVNRLDREGKSPKTIKNVIHMLSSVLALAVDEGHISRNPTRRVRLPKAQAEEHEARFLTEDEAAQLVEATPEHYQPLVTFLFGTGLRWSEATALRTRDVDLDNGTVRVTRAWKRIPGGWEIGPPKSRKARRTVNAAVPALLAVQPLLGKPNDYIFTTTTGKVVRHSNFYNRIWQPACIKAGLASDAKPWDGPGIHDCRHSFASWLLSGGEVGLEGVQDQLGHESYETTRKIYAHLLPAVGVAAGRSASASMRRVLAKREELRGRTLVALESGRDTQHP